MSETLQRIRAGAPIWIDHLAGGFAPQEEVDEAQVGGAIAGHGEGYGPNRLIRPRGLYNGPAGRDVKPIAERG